MPDPATATPDTPASQAVFRLEYDGPALAAGSMNVGELGIALVSVGQLVEQANRIVNADRAFVSVNAKAQFEAGSFDVALEVLQTLASQASLPGTDQVKDVSYLLALLGFADTERLGRVGTSVIKLLKWLADKSVVQKQLNPQTGTVTITTGDNAHIVVNQTVALIAEDEQARRAIEGVIHPLRRPGIDAVRIKQDDHVVDEVRKDDIPPLATLTALDVMKELPDEERVAVVEVVKPAFHEKMAWDFSEGSGRGFTAVVKDEHFLARVSSRSRLFGTGDVLKVRLQTKKSQTATGLRADTIVVEVLEELEPVRPLIPRADDEGVKPKKLRKIKTLRPPTRARRRSRGGRKRK